MKSKHKQKKDLIEVVNTMESVIYHYTGQTDKLMMPRGQISPKIKTTIHHSYIATYN